VLNAKPEHAEREGERIAQAGRRSAVMIATNMAGRGVDIKLGGNAEHQTRLEMAKLGLTPGDPDYTERFAQVLPTLDTKVEEDRQKVVEAGGLFICGTERHESRRIDNQLRGRSGRQGDPGESRFFLSAEDDLIRLFAGERIYKILDRLGPVNEAGEEEALEAKMLSRTIEGAQKKVEEQNFLIRKRVLEYDDVMNEQRRVVYKYRREILEGKDMSDSAREGVGEVVSRLVDDYTPGDVLEDWDLGELQTQVEQLWPAQADISGSQAEDTDREDLREALLADALAAYDKREQEFGDEIMRQLERAILLQIIDNRWREHLYEMDYLREGIHLRGFAQIDPLVAYKNEGFGMFEAMMHSIWEEFARLIFHVEVEVAPRAQEQFAPTGQPVQVDYSGGTAEQPSALGQAAVATASGPDMAAERAIEGNAQAGNGAPVQEQETVVKDEKDKIGRNDPCWCGSGKKYKKCHGA
jgi:preprotein translocase subunit SecA